MRAQGKGGITRLQSLGASLQKERRGKPNPSLRAHFPQTTAGREKPWPPGKVNSLKPWKTPLNGIPVSTATTAPCASVRACVRGCVCACVGVCVRARARRRTGRWEAASPPSGSSSFPACFGPAKWEGETQDGGSRELRLQPPAVRLPDLVSGGATSAGVARPALACAGRAADFSQRAERPKHLRTDKREKCPSGRAACGGTWSLEPGPRNRGNPELGALRCWLRQPLGKSAGCRGASGPWSRTYPNSWLSAWCSCGARYLPPAFCPERARASFLAPIPFQSLASRGCYCSLVRPLPVSRWLGAPWGQEQLWPTPVLLATSAKSGTRGHPCLLGWTPFLPSQVLGNNGIILVFEWSTRLII